MVRTPCYDKNGLRKGSWTSEEDKKLVAYVTRYGCWNWSQLPKFAGLARCGRSCRLRWKNYLSPNIKRGNYTKEEEDTIIRLNESLGNKWSAIAAKLPGRTDNDIKNHWHAALKKRLTQKQSKEDQGKKKFRSKTNNIEEEANKSKNLQNPTTPSIHESSASSVQPCSTDEQSSLISGNGIAADKDFDTILGEDNNALLGEHEALSAVVDNSYIANEYLAPMVNAAYVPNKGGEYKTLDGNFWTEPFLIDNSYRANECLAPMVNPGYVPNGEGEYETLNWDFWTEPFLGDNSYMANEYLAPILNPSC